LSQLTCQSDTQGIETATSDEGVATASTGNVDEEMIDMIFEPTFLGGVTSAALGSLLTAGRAVPVSEEVVPNLSSPYTSTNHL
jgi:hypothetical protein